MAIAKYKLDTELIQKSFFEVLDPDALLGSFNFSRPYRWDEESKSTEFDVPYSDVEKAYFETLDPTRFVGRYHF